MSVNIYQATYRRILPSYCCNYLLLNLIFMQSNIFLISHHHIPFFLSNSLMSQISQNWVSQSIYCTLFWKVTPCILKDVNLTLKSVTLLALRTKWQYVPSTCKGKVVKVTLVQALRLCTGRTAHRGSRGIALLFHDHGTRRGWGVSVTPRPLFTPGKDPVPFVHPSACSIYETTRRHNPEMQELFLEYYFIRYRHIAIHIYTTSRFILSIFLAVTCLRTDLQ